MLYKEAMSKYKLFPKLIELVEKSNTNSPRLPGLFSKNFLKNVDLLINSRASNPSVARPYANFITIQRTDNPILHRIQFLRTVPEGSAGW